MTTSTPAPLLSARGLQKVYGKGGGRVFALRGVDLDVDTGETLAIIGPSGSGKTTLMNILGCLDSPSEGSYRLLDKEVAHLSRDTLARVRNRMLGFVFQSYQLLPRTSALENVQLPLLYAGVGGKELDRRARTALERVGLGDRIHHEPSELSGGQQQRVAIARAIVNTPRVIFADEPTGNLDTQTTIEIMRLFSELSADGLTLIYVTHEPEVAAFASRVIEVRDGAITDDAPNQERPLPSSTEAHP